MELLSEMLTSELMVRALIVAVLVGISAPIVGTYLVQRSMALMGDGIGHIALTGVALGWLIGAGIGLQPADMLAVPGAIVASMLGAIAIEVLRARGRTGSDVALAMLFYGGIAGGVILIRIAGGTTTNLTSYLFGSIATVNSSDVSYTIGLTLFIVAVGIGLRGPLFALSYDPEFSRASGLRVGALNICVAMLAALTVSISMRVVGVLLVSAIMIVPVAIGQLVANSFRGTMAIGMAVGVIVSVAGLVITYIYPFSPGAMIVVLAVGLYIVVAALHPIVQHLSAKNHI